MERKITKIILMSISVLLFVHCNDGFLDKTPLDKMSETAIFNSDALAEAHVNSMYLVIPDPFQEGNISAITDEGFFRYGGTSTRYILSGMMTPTNVMYMSEGGGAHNSRTTTLNIWNRAYKFIYSMNYFLEHVNSANKLTEETKSRLIGEVYFLRAWTYYNLIQRYSGVPIITKVFGLNDEFGIKRNDFDDCVNFILQDLEKAESLVPEKSKGLLGRINKDIVLALRCRLTLMAASPLFNDQNNPAGGILRGTYDKNKWNRAYDAAKAIVDRADIDGAYMMESGYDRFWKNINSTENIWCKFFVSTGVAKKAQLLYSVVYFNGWTALNPTQALIADYEMTNGKKFFEEGSGYDPEHPFKNRDPRMYKTVALPFSKYQHTSGGKFQEEELLLYLQYNGKTREDFKSGKKEPDYDLKAKHLWHSTNTTGIELNKWYIPTAAITESETGTLLYPWFRLPEMYLNLAECAYMLGKEEECRTYINKVRDRNDVKMPHVTESGESLWERIVNERRIEFAFEFMRYFDLRRWKTAEFYENVPIAGMRTMILADDKGMPKDTVYRVVKVYDESTNDKCYYWPNVPASSTYVYAGEGTRKGEAIDYIITYRWLGKEYKLDYGDCCLNISPTPKYFPFKDGVYTNYLMPIPQNEIIKSEGSIEQNPGY